MNEQKNISAGRGRDWFLNRYLTCFTRDAEEILHSVLGDAYRNMACMEQRKCQEYLQYVVDVAEQLAEMLIEIREGLYKGKYDAAEDMEMVDFGELFNEIVTQLKLIYADEELYLLTATDIQHKIVTKEIDRLIRRFTDAVICFIEYKGIKGTYRLEVKETRVGRNRSEICFRIEKTSNCDEEFLVEDREKERAFYLRMENLCHWLQEHEGNLWIQENGYRMTFCCLTEEEEVPLKESRVYTMKDVCKEKNDTVIDLTDFRKRYRQLAGKQILLVVCRRSDILLKELFELIGIRTEMISGMDEVMQRIWWSERGGFDGMIVCTGRCPEDGLKLAEKIGGIEWKDGRKMPVIVIGGDREDMNGKTAVLPEDSPFERILDLLYCSYMG